MDIFPVSDCFKKKKIKCSLVYLNLWSLFLDNQRKIFKQISHISPKTKLTYQFTLHRSLNNC